ncbi:putative tetrahydrofolylpolyglutamate synthase [Tricladium varicosporioides]|nr:putative tetrahydrofolylpolyglutamate synthase [Hymenoscyphus varicosporioides]
MSCASSLPAMDKSYKRAVEILNSSRRPLRPSIELSKSLPSLNRMPNLNGESDLKGTPSILGMRQWLDELGHSVKAADINSLNIIHVAGTKGKGSTCTFIDSFLRAYGRRTGFPRKVGLYTSPHLIHPEERIRINFEPLPRDLFAKYFFEVNDILSRDDHKCFDTRPRYLQILALLAFHTFIREGVDATIIETHHGGEYDSTNVIEKPVVTAITTLGIDHIKQLGSSIESIAWHKAGIFKSGASAFSAPQETAAAEVLYKRATDKGVNLQFADIDSYLTDHIALLKPDVQRTNCSVALAVVRSFLNQKTSQNLSRLSPSDVLQGLNQFSWPGRFQLVIENQFQWFLDSAHNEMSVIIAAEWFLEISKIQKITSSAARILIFSLITDQRDGAAVFERLATSLRGSGIQYVIFTTYERDLDPDPRNNTQPKLLEMPSQDHIYAEIWKRVQPDANIYFKSTIQGALDVARELGRDHGSMQTLITGSQHLVGGALSLLQTTNTL